MAHPWRLKCLCRDLIGKVKQSKRTGDASRRVLDRQGAVKIDGERVDDRGLEIEAGSTHVYQVGKRKFARVRLA